VLLTCEPFQSALRMMLPVFETAQIFVVEPNTTVWSWVAFAHSALFEMGVPARSRVVGFHWTSARPTPVLASRPSRGKEGGETVKLTLVIDKNGPVVPEVRIEPRTMR